MRGVRLRLGLVGSVLAVLFSIPAAYGQGGPGVMVLQNVAIDAPSQRAGAQVAWNTDFTTPVSGNFDDWEVRIEFPELFEVPSGGVGCSLVGHGTMPATISGNAVTCTAGAWNIANGELLTVEITNIRNPDVAIETDNFVVEVRDPAGTLVGHHLDDVETIDPGILTVSSVRAQDPRTGELTSYDFVVRTTNDVAGTGLLRFAFPADLELGSSTDCALSVNGGPFEGLQAQRNGQDIDCLLAGPLSGGQDAVVRVLNVRNPASAITQAGAIVAQSRNAAQLVHDEWTLGALPLDLDPHQFDSLAATLTSEEPGAIIELIVSVVPHNPVPADAIFEIVMPACWGIDAGGDSAFKFGDETLGSFQAATVDGSTLTANRAPGGEEIEAGTGYNLHITHLENPTEPCDALDLTFTTLSAGSFAIDEGVRQLPCTVSPCAPAGGDDDEDSTDQNPVITDPPGEDQGGNQGDNSDSANEGPTGGDSNDPNDPGGTSGGSSGGLGGIFKAMFAPNNMAKTIPLVAAFVVLLGGSVAGVIVHFRARTLAARAKAAEGKVLAVVGASAPPEAEPGVDTTRPGEKPGAEGTPTAGRPKSPAPSPSEDSPDTDAKTKRRSRWGRS